MGVISDDTQYFFEMTGGEDWAGLAIGRESSAYFTHVGLFRASNSTARAALLTAATSGTSALDTLIGGYTTAPGSGPTPDRSPASWWGSRTSSEKSGLAAAIIAAG